MFKNIYIEVITNCKVS